MRFDIITIFPELFQTLRYGVVGRAWERGLLDIEVTDLRDHAAGRHRQVDDVPFGGGPGMVLKPEPVFAAVETAQGRNRGPVVILEPWGERLDQRLARELATEPGLILVCGRYEGIDDRVRQGFGAREISIGDYVLSGGEIPALVVVDAVARLLPGVVGDPDSLAQDSFAEDPGGYPQYTRPAEYRGLKVPEVLLSGHHSRIRAWRHEQALLRRGAGDASDAKDRNE